MQDISVKEQLKIQLAIWLTIICWGSAFVGIRLGLASYSPGALALFRYLVASVLMIILYIMEPNRHRPTWRECCYIFITGALGIGVYNVALNTGEQTVSAGIASFIVGTMPVFSIILAIFTLNEKTYWISWLGVVTSIIGVTLIALSTHHHNHYTAGVIYTLIATIMGTIYAILQKPLLKKFSPTELVAFFIWSGTAVMMFYAPKLIHQLPHASLTATTSAIYMGIFPAAIAYTTWSYALSKMPASCVVTYLYALPIASTIMAILILHEIPTILALIGGIIALSGAFIASRARHHTTHSS